MVDAGRVKQLSYDPATRMTSLDDVRVSAAAAKQRHATPTPNPDPNPLDPNFLNLTS